MKININTFKILINIIFTLIILISCKNKSIINEFENCYPIEKQKSLNSALVKLDNKIQKLYPDSNLISAYKAFAWECCKDSKYYKILLSEHEKLNLKSELFKSGVLNDFRIDYEKGINNMNFKGDYYLCLLKHRKNDKLIDEYLNFLELTGEHWTYAYTIGQFPEINKTDGLNDFHIFLMKAELLINLIE